MGSTIPFRGAGSSPLRLAAAAAGTAVAAGIGTLIVATFCKAAGAPASARQLHASTYLPLVVIGVVLGLVGWRVIASRAGHPASVLRRVVPAVVALSLIPDLLLRANGSGWSTVGTLMVMHLSVAAIAVPIFARLIPIEGRGMPNEREFRPAIDRP